MKTFIKITAVVMAMLICCAAFVSCGGGDTKGSDANGGDAGNAASVSGKTQTWGNITVLVPDDMNFKGGSMLDEKDPNVVNISKKDNATNYFYDQLPKGTRTIETEYFVDRAGKYQSGSITMQCAYAPAFAARDKAITFVVK